MSAHVAAPSAPMTFREVLSGVIAPAPGVRAVFLLCAVFAWVLTGAGKLLLSTERHAAAI